MKIQMKFQTTQTIHIISRIKKKFKQNQKVNLKKTNQYKIKNQKK